MQQTCLAADLSISRHIYIVGYTAASRLQTLRDCPPLSAAQGFAILGGSLHTNLQYRQ